MQHAGKSFPVKLFKYIYLFIGAVVVAIPLFYILLSGFKTTYEINSVLSFPSSFYIKNFLTVFESKMVMFSFVNSLIITCAAFIVDFSLCSIAAYPISRRNEKIFRFIYLYFLSAMMIPAVANLASLFTIIKNLGLKDTRTGLVLVFAAMQIPMGILLYASFIKTIPRALEEAAIIDGCGYLRRFVSVIFPLLKPVTITYAIVSSIAIWNDFLIPMVLLSDKWKKPITLAVYSFVNEHQSDFGPIYAALIIAIIPPILLFIFSQKYFYSGITAGSIKG